MTHFFLLDDDQDELQIFLDATRHLLFESFCTFVQHPTEAFRLMWQMQPDVIFVDMNMPHLDGVESIKSIRLIDGYQDAYIVLYSNALESDGLELARKAGADEFIKKTYSISKLVNHLQRVQKLAASKKIR